MRGDESGQSRSDDSPTEWLDHSRRVGALTISTASGIPDFWGSNGYGRKKFQAGEATAAGLFLGLAIAAATLRTMRRRPFGLDVYDVPTIVIVVATLSVVTILAITLPALRVATIDPAKTLRED